MKIDELDRDNNELIVLEDEVYDLHLKYEDAMVVNENGVKLNSNPEDKLTANKTVRFIDKIRGEI